VSGYFDKEGNPLELMEWARMFETEEARASYKRVAETTLPNGRWVSTVWLGIDHSFGSGPPLIFETMVFSSKKDMNDLDCDRYSTEAQAKQGHERMCAKWLAESVDPEGIEA